MAKLKWALGLITTVLLSASPAWAARSGSGWPLGRLSIGSVVAFQLPATDAETARARAEAARRALLTAFRPAEGEPIGPIDLVTAVRVESDGPWPVVSVRNQPVVTIGPADVACHRLAAEILAARYAARLRALLAALDLRPTTPYRSLVARLAVDAAPVSPAAACEADQCLADDAVVTGVRRVLAADPDFRAAGLARELFVEATGGVVTLRGEVAEPQLGARLIERVRAVPGVRGVVDEVAVREVFSP